MEEVYDSTKDTQEHINKVANYLNMCCTELRARGYLHDGSKLLPPEKEYFDKYTPELANLVYGTEEYRESCRRLKPAIDHHYKNNTHHPQHFENGVNGMNLFDILEMLMDWRASGERNSTGDIRKSLEINAERFGMSKQLKSIFINTIDYLKW